MFYEVVWVHLKLKELGTNISGPDRFSIMYLLQETYFCSRTIGGGVSSRGQHLAEIE